MKQSFALVAIFLGILVNTQAQAQATAPTAAPTVAAVDFASLSGTYQMAPTFQIRIWEDGGHYMAQATGQGAFEIFPESADTFYAKLVAVKFVFKKDSSGKVTHFVMLQGGIEQSAKKIS